MTSLEDMVRQVRQAESKELSNHIGGEGFTNGGTQDGWFIVENTMKMDHG